MRPGTRPGCARSRSGRGARFPRSARPRPDAARGRRASRRGRDRCRRGRRRRGGGRAATRRGPSASGLPWNRATCRRAPGPRARRPRSRRPAGPGRAASPPGRTRGRTRSPRPSTRTSTGWLGSPAEAHGQPRRLVAGLRSEVDFAFAGGVGNDRGGDARGSLRELEREDAAVPVRVDPQGRLGPHAREVVSAVEDLEGRRRIVDVVGPRRDRDAIDLARRASRIGVEAEPGEREGLADAKRSLRRASPFVRARARPAVPRLRSRNGTSTRPRARSRRASLPWSSWIGSRERRPSRNLQTETHAEASVEADTSSSAPALPSDPAVNSTWTTSAAGAGAFPEARTAPSGPRTARRTAPRSDVADTVSSRPSPSRSTASVGPRGSASRSARSAAASAGAATALPPSCGPPPRRPRSRCASACRRRRAC